MDKTIKNNPFYCSLINFVLFLVLLFSFNVPMSFANEVDVVSNVGESQIVSTTNENVPKQ